MSLWILFLFSCSTSFYNEPHEKTAERQLFSSVIAFLTLRHHMPVVFLEEKPCPNTDALQIGTTELPFSVKSRATSTFRRRDVQVLHGFDSAAHAEAYLSSAMFSDDVVIGLKPYLNAAPDIRIYTVA